MGFASSTVINSFLKASERLICEAVASAMSSQKHLRENLGIHLKFSDEWYTDINTMMEIGRSGQLGSTVQAGHQIPRIRGPATGTDEGLGSSGPARFGRWGLPRG